MPAYQTPGVYYERVDANVGGISAIRTDVAGFVGIAERGPVDIPVPVESWRQFQAYFGDFNGKGFLAYAVRGFFENGGRRCWVVRVASKDPNGGADYAGTIIKCQSGENAWRIRAFAVFWEYLRPTPELRFFTCSHHQICIQCRIRYLYN